MNILLKEPIETEAPVSSYIIDEASQQDSTENSDKISAEEATATIPTPPELRSDYCFIKQIGAGAQGCVYLAKRLADDKQVAIKQLRIDSIKTWKEYTLFHREAEVLADVNIPGVVKLCETREYLEANPPCSYIIQEYIKGRTLKEVLQSGYRFSPSRVYDIALQLLNILEQLHKHEPPIIHRDIKPSNIILQKQDNDDIKVFLIDFGAVANPHIQNGGSTIAGTVGYMSPEQYVGQPKPQSDIYALGALLTYMLSGTDPAEIPVRELRLIIDPYVENQPPTLVQTLRRMLEPDITKRLCDYDELRTRFTNFKFGNFSLENETTDDLTSEVLEAQLKQVKSLCQPGNLEIWQSLPDLPEKRPQNIHFKTCERDFKLRKLDTKQLANNENQINQPSGLTLLFIFFTIFNVIAFLVLIFFGGLLVSDYFHLITPSEYLNAFIYLLISTPILFILWQKSYQRDQERFKINHAKSDYGHRMGKTEVESCKCLDQIYTYGRKTIATITDIKFLEARSAVPTFYIYYKFNPPDDDTPNDIVHEIQTHIMPNNKFKVGDPLPILYTIDYEKPNYSLVRSMPFPLPLQDLVFSYDYSHNQGRPFKELKPNTPDDILNIMKAMASDEVDDDTIDISKCISQSAEDFMRQDYIDYLDHVNQTNASDDERCISSPYLKAISKIDAQLFQTY